MSRIHADNVMDELFSFRVNPSWEEECISADASVTPGIFYHGSPNVNIGSFQANLDLSASTRTQGIFFTQCPAYAALYVVDRGFSFGGRIYKCELVTRNPYFAPYGEWGAQGAYQRDVERSICREIKLAGYDSIVTAMNDATVWEIVVLDESVIQPLGGNLENSVSEFTDAPLIFYQADSAPGHPLDPNCVPLVSAHAKAVTGHGQPVGIGANIPIYCDRSTWGRMDLDILRHFSVDLLVDPADGSALLLDQSKMWPLNRRLLRALKSKPQSRKHAMQRKRLQDIRPDHVRVFSCDIGGEVWQKSK